MFTHLDSGIIYLIRHLMVDPGNTVREYLEGKRKKYYNPFQFYILTTAVIVFLTIKLDLGSLMINDIQNSGDLDIFKKQFIPFLYPYFNVLQFIILPLLSFYTYLLFRRSGYNYAENLILNTFISSERHIIYVLFIPFMYFFPAYSPLLSRIYILFWIVYFSWAYIKFFAKKQALGYNENFNCLVPFFPH